MLTDQDRSSIREETTFFSLATLNRGLGYAMAGRVVDLRVKKGPVIHAKVRGTKVYSVEIHRRGNGQWLFYCDCPVDGPCKHAAAVTAVASGLINHEKPQVPRGYDPIAEQWIQRLQAFSSTRAAAASKVDRVRLRMDRNHFRWERSGDGRRWKRAAVQFIAGLASDWTNTAPFADESQRQLFLLLRTRRETWCRDFSLSLSRSSVAVFVGALLASPLTRDVVVNQDGSPFEFAATPLNWHIEPEDRFASLALRSETESPSGPFQVIPKPGGWFYLFGNTIYEGPQPIQGIETPGPHAIPRAALEAVPSAIQVFTKRGARVAETITRDFAPPVLRPKMIIALDRGRFGREEWLRVDMLAHEPKIGIAFVWAAGQGWIRHPTATSPLLESQTDTSEADQFVPWLAELGLSFHGAQNGWRREIDRSFPERFAEWARALPPGLDLEVASELKPFFEPGRSSVEFRFDIQPTPGRPDWFDLRAELQSGDLELSPAEIDALLRARGRLVRLESGGWARAEIPEEAIHLADALGLPLHGRETERTLHVWELAGHDLDGWAPDAMRTIRDRTNALVKIEPPAIPAAFHAELRAYQREGFHFLAHLSTNGFGGLLADDMGLGKTIQTLAWLAWLAERSDSPFRALVICPKSVVFNWHSEAARFCPDLPASVFAPGCSLPENGLVIVNYTQFRLASETFLPVLWGAVILDEGQNIKNPASQTARLTRDLQASHRLVLSGTPVENRAMDLWSLFAFAQPGLLGSQASFKRLYDAGTPESAAALQRRVRHFLLRRTKSQVAPELPLRTEEDFIVELEGEQKDLYAAELKKIRRLSSKLETGRAFDKARFNILQSLLRLRQICCDPRLTGNPASSAKLDALLDLVGPLAAEGQKVLVFSQFVEMLKLIAERLEAESISHLQITGKTNDRRKVVGKFQSDESIPVLLLSLKAAGTGLNLTAASYVVLFDPWWNPAAEAQAIDRTHRIGQVKPVIAYRLIARGTIEEKIRLLQTAKSALANAVVSEDSLASVLDLESLKYLLAE